MHSRSWETPPAPDAISSEFIVWIESTTAKIGRTRRIASITEPRSVSARTRIPSLAMPNRRARILICAADSSPDT